MSFDLEKFVVEVEEAKRIFPTWREGQILFNVLYVEYSDLANEIRATEYDPFYQEERIPAFWGWLQTKQGETDGK